LIVRGHRLVSDDLVVLRRKGDIITGTSPQLTRYHMELRGIGIINVRDIFGIASVRTSKDVDLVVTLDLWKTGKAYDRLGIDDHSHELLGVSLDYIEMPVAPGRNLAVLVELTARNQLLKRKGHNPARELAHQLDRKLADGGGLLPGENE
jgi:HPr kinase/phosphorylase